MSLMQIFLVKLTLAPDATLSLKNAFVRTKIYKKNKFKNLKLRGSFISRDLCDTSFPVKFNVEFPRQALDYPLISDCCPFLYRYIYTYIYTYI